MARTKTITDAQILEAAREEFLERGFAATTAEIARRAGISEGTIFRRYANKGELFLAAMGIPKTPAWVEILDDLVGRGDLYQNLIAICSEILDFLVEIIPKKVVMLSCRAKLEDLFGKEVEPAPIRGMKALTNFIDEERKRGRLRPCDPEVVARTLIGGLHHYAFAEVSGLNRRMPLASTSYVRGLIDIVWRGVAPPAADVPATEQSGAPALGGKPQR